MNSQSLTVSKSAQRRPSKNLRITAKELTVTPMEQHKATAIRILTEQKGRYDPASKEFAKLGCIIAVVNAVPVRLNMDGEDAIPQVFEHFRNSPDVIPPIVADKIASDPADLPGDYREVEENKEVMQFIRFGAFAVRAVQMLAEMPDLFAQVFDSPFLRANPPPPFPVADDEEPDTDEEEEYDEDGNRVVVYHCHECGNEWKGKDEDSGSDDDQQGPPEADA